MLTYCGAASALKLGLTSLCLQAELLHVIAVAANERQHTRHKTTTRHTGVAVAEYAADVPTDPEARRVRQRRE